MTRVEQWWKRRQRYIRRSHRYWNATTRQRTLDPDGDPHHRGGHHDAKGVFNYGLQSPPRVKYSTYLAQRPRHFIDAGVIPGVAGPIGYGKPPHYKILFDLFAREGHHRHIQGMYGPLRPVAAVSRPLERMADGDVLSFKAWIYWRYRGAWPAWDPKNRTPVDSPGKGIDEEWNPRYD